MKETTTTDLTKFGHREKRMATELLTAMQDQGLPEDFYDDEVTIMFNAYSGCVFLTNSDFQVAMMNDNNLEMWYSCPICGHEGFAEEMEHGEDNHECQEWLRESGLIENEDED